MRLIATLELLTAAAAGGVRGITSVTDVALVALKDCRLPTDVEPSAGTNAQ